MQRNSQEIADEILRRVEIANKKEAAKKKKIYSVLAMAVCLALVIGLSFVIPVLITDSVTPDANGTYSAAMFADGRLGGYAIIGVIGFALGVTVTIFCYWKFRKE